MTDSDQLESVDGQRPADPDQLASREGQRRKLRTPRRLQIHSIAITLSKDMASPFKNPEFLTLFFETVTYQTWGSFFPRITPIHVEASERDAISFICEFGLVPDAALIEQRQVKCEHLDLDGEKTGTVKCYQDTSRKFEFFLSCSKFQERIRKRKEFNKRKKSVPAWLKTTCSPRLEITAGTWFCNVKIPVQENLFLMFAWVCGLPVSDIPLHCGISKKTAIDWYSMCREVCEIVISHEAERQIGGEGMVVEVDETYLMRRKYGRGRELVGESITVFGMYCRETKEGIFLKVKNKSRAVLWAQMARYIKPGSRIATDGAIMYRNCDDALGFSQHMVVVHKVEFVNKEDPEAHINGVECRNRWVKRQIKSHQTDRQLSSYMCEYWYRVMYFKNQESKKRPYGVSFKRFLEDVKRCYPGVGTEALALIEIGVTEEEMEAFAGDAFQMAFEVRNPDGGPGVTP